MSSAEPARVFQQLLSLAPEQVRSATFSGMGTLQASGERFSYTVRFLFPDDVGLILRLHQDVLANLPNPLLLYVRDRDFFAQCVGKRGCVAGAFQNGRLLGYAAGWIPPTGQDNYGKDLGLTPDDLPHVAHLAGSCIHPAYRGNRLHAQLVGLRSALLHSEGFYHQCGEVLPRNVFSIKNHLAGGYYLKGFKVDDFRFDDEGAPHFLLHRDTRSDPRRDDEENPPESRIDDIPTYRRMLDEGRWGYRIRYLDGEPHLAYGVFA